MNLAWRDIKHTLFRFVLTCVGLGLLLGVVLAMIGIYRGLVVDALTIARAPAVDLWVVEAKSRGPFAEASRIPGATREAVARIAGVAAAGAITYQTVEADHMGAKLRLYLIGYEPTYPGGPPEIVAGRAIARAHYEIVADRTSGLVIGDRLRLGRDAYEIVGLTRAQVNSGGDPAVYLTLADAQRIQFELAAPALRLQLARGGQVGSTDTVNAVIARLAPNASADAVRDAIVRWKHLGALTQSQQEDILTQSLVDRARRQIGLFTSLLLTVSAVVIALIVYTMTMEKLKSIATLKLIGAPDRVIVMMIVQQALALGLIGFVIGATLILNVKDNFPRRVILEIDNIAALGLVVAVVCLVASALGVRAALRVDPATALGG
jgi:putative ABC transport system permease protein